MTDPTPTILIEGFETRPFVDIEWDVYDDLAPDVHCGPINPDIGPVTDEWIATQPDEVQALINAARASGRYDFLEVWADNDEGNFVCLGYTDADTRDEDYWPIARWGTDTRSYEELEAEYLASNEDTAVLATASTTALVNIPVDSTRPLTDAEWQVYIDLTPDLLYDEEDNLSDGWFNALPEETQALIREALASGRYDFLEVWYNDDRCNSVCVGLREQDGEFNRYLIARWGTDTRSYTELYDALRARTNQRH